MPKGIRKASPKNILSEIEKLKSGVQQREQMIDNCKRECSEKVKAWRHEIAVEQSQIRKLKRDYDTALLEEQKKMVSAILFSSHFTADEISDVVLAVELLFSCPDRRVEAIGIVQKLADKHHSAAIRNAVNDVELPDKKTGRGSGLSPGSGAAALCNPGNLYIPDSETETL
ncbi:MAG: hypothetical protein K6E36_11370 [Oscillospiraceae bacterium]|nr:hypothetical protein [Oscillospiraceae bacterium]